MLLNHSLWEFLDPLPIAQLLKGICILFSVVFSSVYNQTLLFLSPYPQMALTDKILRLEIFGELSQVLNL